MNVKQLMLFIESLYERGLLSLTLDEFDYEWVCWDYLNSIGKDKSITYLNYNEQEKTNPYSPHAKWITSSNDKELSEYEYGVLKKTASRLISDKPTKL